MPKSIVKVPDILLPKDVDLFKWAVVACDQFCAEPDYWNKLKSVVGDSPSTLNITLPEIYLEDNPEERIKGINATIDSYMQGGVFQTVEQSFILISRDTKFVKDRQGLVLAVDLDCYDFTPFSDAYIKATEKTIVERIPPRAKIREHAAVELPHIMLLIDDKERTVIEPLFEDADKLTKLYDSDLNMEGGHIRGWRVTDTQPVIDALNRLLDEDVQTAKYGKATNFLFAAGDGNHSLATAKAHWERIKATLPESERDSHPAKYALVEVMNIYSDSLKFEPIHRVLFGAGEEFITAFTAAMQGDATAKVYYKGGFRDVCVKSNSAEAIAQIMDFIDAYLRDNPSVSIEYVHGLEHLTDTCDVTDGIGIVMPAFEKSLLFDYVLKKGILPRKAFSMGEAEEKRYYLEARRITPVGRR